MNIVPVILSGGAGTRLWPLSREAHPKQFLNLLDNSSLITNTVARLDKIEAVDKPIVVCNEYHRFKVAQHITDAGRWPCDVILEPCARNTAPAIATAALHASRDENDPLLLVMPADHVIKDEEAFASAVMEMAEIAAAGYLVTFGITPESPATGYGYICAGDEIADSSAKNISAFVEKPDRETAESYLASGNYFWNSGIFLFCAGTLLQQLEEHAPDILESCMMSYSRSEKEGTFIKLNSEDFAGCRSESIDYAVMEQTTRAVVTPISMGWSDIGSWESLWEVHPKDEAGNAIAGEVVNIDCESSYLRSSDRTLAVLGVKDLVVVDTDDALLIVHRSRSEEVKTLLQQVAVSEPEKATQHRTVHRPWGCYRSTDAAERFQVKRITVNPGAQLSLQMHHHRAEHWIVVRGTANVTIEDKVFVLKENESTFIPIGAKHRLENPGRIPLELIEVQSGSYLGEDDIVRFDDVYGRETPSSANVVNI
ncbi:mannose-1-phosphate guanylyltransferase/mannose-6-phosphate isomerase [Kaarinaea lacus]